MPKDYYVVLGINRGADLNKIKRAYRRIIKKYHPDISRSDETTERFFEIKEAYETLSNEEKRRSYDQELFGEPSPANIPRAPEPLRTPTPPLDDATRQDVSFPHGFLAQLIQGFAYQDTTRPHPRDLHLEAVLSPREASEGGVFPLSLSVALPCPRCSNTGPWKDIFCPLCEGRGRICSERRLALRIPPFVRHGTQIRIPLDEIGLKHGCLCIRVLIASHLVTEDGY